VPVAVTAPWPASPNAIVGGWSNLVIGIREDVNFTISRDGVLLDDDGNVVVSAFQDDMTLVRVYARFGVVIARPLAADGTGPSRRLSARRGRRRRAPPSPRPPRAGGHARCRESVRCTLGARSLRGALPENAKTPP
jgi:hypothetical protein